MFRKVKNWFFKPRAPKTTKRSMVAWTPKTDMPTSPKSHPFPYDMLSIWDEKNDFLPPPGADPRMMFPLFRRLRDYIPDVSAGVWSWVRLCSTQQSITLYGGDEADQTHARSVLRELDRRIYGLKTERAWGVEALVNSFFMSIFTYGSFCGEVVLDNRRNKIDRFVIIDPATIRFKLNRADRSFSPYQIRADGSLHPLNEASFFYFGLDSDGLSPYGRSPLMALPLVVKMQQQMLHDMEMAQHNAGYPTIHFRIKPTEKFGFESDNDYHQRLNEELKVIQQELRAKRADSNLITYDNIVVTYIAPNGKSVQWSESLQAVSEQVIAALHLAPFMLGRNWGTTESWGLAQYQLLMNNARTVQAGARRLAEWLYNLELILHEIPVKATYHFEAHHHLDAFNQARTFRTMADAMIHLQEKNLLSEKDIKQKMEEWLKKL